jgi:4-hydroxy-tetrahydrodipicolinate reductase
MKIGVYGATGRVGRLIVDLIHQDDGLELGSVFFKGDLDFSLDPSVLISKDVNAFLEACDIVIDFSLPEATETLLEAALKHPRPLVIGTTGLIPHQQNLMVEAATKMPILYATNMSMGVAVLNNLVAKASKTLREYDIEITEMHHRYKVDAPSGTALTLAHSAANARELNLADVMTNGRSGNIGERTKDEIAVMALRGGDIVGQHTVGLYNDGEFIQLHHTATNRNTFAKGAINAAKWLISQPNGQYTINDSLGLE